MVMPVPESGIPAAQGFARAAGIPYGDGLVKNRYVGRTFIQPSQQLRTGGVRLKLNPLPENIRGKRLIVVDDSVVRGTTTAPGGRDAAGGGRGGGALPCVVAAVPLALLLRHGHRPPIGAARGRHVGRRDRRLPQRRLARVPRARSTREHATDTPGDSFCTACLSGRYPVPVPELADSKLALEEPSLLVGAATTPVRRRPSRPLDAGARDGCLADTEIELTAPDALPWV